MRSLDKQDYYSVLIANNIVFRIFYQGIFRIKDEHRCIYSRTYSILKHFPSWDSQRQFYQQNHVINIGNANHWFNIRVCQNCTRLDERYPCFHMHNCIIISKNSEMIRLHFQQHKCRLLYRNGRELNDAIRPRAWVNICSSWPTRTHERNCSLFAETRMRQQT